MNSKSKPPAAAAAKIRLMCSYGGRILPRPFDNNLFYAGGETRIVALDRRTTAASLSTLTSYLSRAVFNECSFRIKYQLPNEDLDSLISVVTDEDLFNMIEEHDRITAPARIRLFLFPAQLVSGVSTLHDPKSESLFGDALKRAIFPRERPAEYVPPLMDAPTESGGNGGEDRNGAESVVLETNLSFGSSSSSISVLNSPPVEIVQCEDNRSNLLERKIRVPSSASMESVNSVGIATPSSNTELCQEPLIQFAPEPPPFLVESGICVSYPSNKIASSNPVEASDILSAYQPDGKQPPQETPFSGGGFHYTPQYAANPTPVPTQMSMFYPVYEIPMHHGGPGTQNQMYPFYLLPIAPAAQYHTISMQCDLNESNTTGQPSLHPRAAVTCPSIVDKEIFGSHAFVESSMKSYETSGSDTPSCQDQLAIPQHVPPLISSVPVVIASAATATCGSEFGEDIAYNPIYKSQPPPPTPIPQYQMVPQPNSTKHPVGQ